MRGVALTFPAVLPRGWPRRVRSAVVQVISLAGTSMAVVRGWASGGMNSSLRRRAGDNGGYSPGPSVKRGRSSAS
jgi:hypothetical protein